MGQSLFNNDMKILQPTFETLPTTILRFKTYPYHLG